MVSLRVLAATALATLPAASAQLVSTGLSVTLNNVYLYISPFASGNVTISPGALKSVPSVHGFKPVTVVQGGVLASSLPTLFTNWTAADDVFQTGFTGAVFLAGTNASCITKREVTPGQKSIIVPLSSTTIPSGRPSATGILHPVYRLYSDFAGAFAESLLQTPGMTFQPLSAQMPGSASLTIGVPSRLYYTRTAAKPLAGVRIGVKDIFQLAGTKGSNGNRAWYNLYPAATTTGTAMQRLLDAGAVFVGLQKPSQFANGESPTADWVDYHSPFNPRGDGYSDPSSSSSGAGASMGSYDWLDIAIGSDTGGSIRGPSGAQGLFGNRPSHGLVSLDHAMPLATTLDTVGFLLRDPHLWDTANAVIYGSNYTSLAGKAPKFPTTIYTLGFGSNTTTNPASRMLQDFAAKLATFVGGSVTAMTLEAEWASSKPSAAGPWTLSQFLNRTYATIIAKEQTALVRDPFYADYAAAHDGRKPFVDPSPLVRWAYGDTLPASDLTEALSNKTIFMDWFNSKILTPVSDPLQCSSGILLYAGSTGGMSPRNVYRSAPGVPFGFSNGRISVFSEAPDSVYPLGEVASRSSITGKDELMPVAVDIMAAKGCDGLLAKLAQDLTDAGILTVPKVGGSMLGGVILP